MLKNDEWIPGKTPLPAPPTPPQTQGPWLSEKTQKKLTTTGLNFFNGLTEAFTLPKILPVSLISEPVRMVQTQVFSMNLLYLGIALGIDYLHDQFQDEESDEKSLTKLLLITGYAAISSLVFFRFLLRSTVDNMSMGSAVRKSDLPHLKELSCQCEFNASIPGVLNDPMANLINVFFMSFLGLLPGVGRPGAFVFSSIIYGNSLIQSRLSMCLEHRRDYIKHHIWGAIGYGTSFILTAQLAYLAVNRLTGRDGFLIYDALFTLIYQQFILHAHLANLNFAADEWTFDPSYLQRRATDAYLEDLTPWLKEAFSGQNEPVISHKALMEIVCSKPIRLITSIDLRSRDQFLENPSIRLFVKLIQPTLMNVIDGLSEIPSNQGVKLGKRLEKWGKMVGIQSEKLNLARMVWDLRQKGYFNPEFLEPIRASINKAAGVEVPKVAIIPRKPLKPKEIDAVKGDEIYHDASNEEPIPATHTQRMHTFSHSYDAGSQPGRDGKKPLTENRTHNKEPSMTVRKKNTGTPVTIIQDYEGERPKVTGISQSK